HAEAIERRAVALGESNLPERNARGTSGPHRRRKTRGATAFSGSDDMASEHTIPDGPDPDPFEAELVAYLDGELDPAAARKVEARLAKDPAARARAAELKKSFDLLDYLPRPEPSPTFTTRTLDKLPVVPSGLSSAAAAPAPQQAAAARR